MRRRYQVNLYTEHTKHLDLIEHLMKFDKNKRSGELTMLLLAGYQVLYGQGNGLIDRSTSILLEEQERMMSLLLQRGSTPQGVQQGQAPGTEVYAQPHSHPDRSWTNQSETIRRSEIKSSSEGGQEKTKAPEIETSRVPIEKPTEKIASVPRYQESMAPKYNSDDLVDEDPSISMVEEPDLEEDVVDPLSLL